MMAIFILLFCSLVLFTLSSTWFWLGLGLLVWFQFSMLFNLGVVSDYMMVAGQAGLDMMSYFLIILSLYITLLMYLSSGKIFNLNQGVVYFFYSVLILLFILVCTFFVVDLFSFYFFFEASLVPTMVIIMCWGYQPERLQAGIYFLFYTLAASLPLIVVIVYASVRMNCSLMIASSFFSSTGFDFLIFLFLILAFLTKLPMFFVHVWLSKAHVEAPVAGSMILAGVLLKLGGYGLYRVIFFCPSALSMYGSYLFGLSILGMVYVGGMCCRINDLKALVAYSSVAHMGMVVMGVASGYWWGLSGCLMMMLSHGLVSSGMFCGVNLFYERLESRSFFLNSGAILLTPIFCLLFFFLCVYNMAAPPSVNLLSEIFLMASMMKFDYGMMLLFPLGSFLGAVFTLFLFSYSQHGKTYTALNSFFLGRFNDYHVLLLHVASVSFLVVSVDMFMYMN